LKSKLYEIYDSFNKNIMKYKLHISRFSMFKFTKCFEKGCNFIANIHLGNMKAFRRWRGRILQKSFPPNRQMKFRFSSEEEEWTESSDSRPNTLGKISKCLKLHLKNIIQTKLSSSKQIPSRRLFKFLKNSLKEIA